MMMSQMWIVKRSDGLMLSNSVDPEWTSDFSQAAEYDTEKEANRDIDCEELTDCKAVQLY
jgi:hypothetical protein